MTEAELRVVDLRSDVFLAVRNGYSVPRWVRLVNKIERVEAGSVLGITELAAAYEPDGTCTLVQPDTMDGVQQFEMTESLEAQLDEAAPSWRFVVIECDIDGRDSAAVFEGEGTSGDEYEYLDFDTDPIRDFVADQQTELQRIGRAYYGS